MVLLVQFSLQRAPSRSRCSHHRRGMPTAAVPVAVAAAATTASAAAAASPSWSSRSTPWKWWRIFSATASARASSCRCTTLPCRLSIRPPTPPPPPPPRPPLSSSPPSPLFFVVGVLGLSAAAAADRFEYSKLILRRAGQQQNESQRGGNATGSPLQPSPGSDLATPLSASSGGSRRSQSRDNDGGDDNDDGDDGDTPLLQVLFQAYDPVESNGVDFVVQVRFEELVVVAPAVLLQNVNHRHAHRLRALQSFIVSEDVKFYFSELEALWLTRMHGLREMMKENRAYLRSLLADNGKRTLLDIDVEAPVLVLPEDPSVPSTPYLMVDLGRVRVATEKLHEPMQRAPPPEITLLEETTTTTGATEQQQQQQQQQHKRSRRRRHRHRGGDDEQEDAGAFDDAADGLEGGFCASQRRRKRR